jgi:hypothetical protein
MSVLNENQLIGASAAGEYEIEQSLRFDDGRGSYLSWTPASAGNRKTWTYSIWVKRGNLGIYGKLFHEYSGQTARSELAFDTSDFLRFNFGGDVETALKPTQVFRDTSAWYHIIWSVDTTQSTASDRANAYINGVKITDFSEENYPALNAESGINLASQHEISGKDGASQFIDGYLAEINFIDGQALTPDSFGETGDYGEWKPKAYAGTYGTNGFYLPFEQDYAVEGFSTVTYEGNGTSGHYIGGTGFEPSLVWLKQRSNNNSHALVDQVRGVLKGLSSDSTAAENTFNHVKSFESDGFTVGTSAQANSNNATYVAWNWDMGGTTASNTSGSITSSVRANTTYGQSIVRATYSGSGTQTFGHGLGAAPDLILGKAEDHAYGWGVYHSGLSSPETKSLALNTTAAATTNNKWANTLPTSSVFSVNIGSLEDAGYPVIFYCFASVTGYSKFGSYEGTGGTHTITTGFAPAFVMIKNADASGNWTMWDNTRNPNNPVTQLLRANTSGAEETKTDREPSFLSTGFSIGDADADTNVSGQTYIYMAFADTREYAYWLDQSGNNNDWTSNGGLTESDVMVDSPTNNFCTFNAVDNAATLSEGNLKAVTRIVGGMRSSITTIGMPSSKWYAEILVSAIGDNSAVIGVLDAEFTAEKATYQRIYAYTGGSVCYITGGNKYINGTSSAYGAAFVAGDVVGVAIDIDGGTVTFYKNNVSQGSITLPTSSSGVWKVVIDSGTSIAAQTYVANFGADSSFAGNKTPQGNQDANDIGDFYYAPPTGFLALCTQNLPDPTVIPSEHFNTLIYTGTDSDNRTITGVGFQPDFAWFKRRNSATNHGLFDSIRGANKRLSSNLSDAEFSDSNALMSFNSDGYVVSSDGTTNAAGTYVSWNWKAGGAASSNTNGSITSSVSANVDAGFSIATFVLPTTAQTIGHGLSKPPELIFQKGRATGSAWWTFAKPIGNTKALRLDSTTNSVTSQNFWNNTDPTSTVVTIGANSGSNNNWLMYCFHSVDGYSKVGSYTGNGSATDGTFVHCGFKPAWVMIKRTDAAEHWRITDNARDPFNNAFHKLQANESNAEGTSAGNIFDLTSNGFKLRATNSGQNASGGTYIFLAFAESPFKHSNAR